MKIALFAAFVVAHLVLSGCNNAYNSSKVPSGPTAASAGSRDGNAPRGAAETISRDNVDAAKEAIEKQRAAGRAILATLNPADRKYFSDNAEDHFCCLVEETDAYRCYLEIGKKTDSTVSAEQKYFVILVHKIGREAAIPMPKFYGDDSYAKRFGEEVWPAIRQKIPTPGPQLTTVIVIQNHVAGWYVCLNERLSVTQSNPRNVVPLGTVKIVGGANQIVGSPYQRDWGNRWEYSYAGLQWAPDVQNVYTVKGREPLHPSLSVGSIDALIANIELGPEQRRQFVAGLVARSTQSGGTRETEAAAWREWQERMDGTAKKKADDKAKDLAYRQRKLEEFAANREALRARYASLLEGLDANSVRAMSGRRPFEGYQNSAFLQKVFSGDFATIFSWEKITGGERPEWVKEVEERRDMAEVAFGFFHHAYEKRFGADPAIPFQRLVFSFDLIKKEFLFETTTQGYTNRIFRVRPEFASRFDTLWRQRVNLWGLDWVTNMYTHHKSLKEDIQKFLANQSSFQSPELRLFEANLFLLAEEGVPPVQMILRP